MPDGIERVQVSLTTHSASGSWLSSCAPPGVISITDGYTLNLLVDQNILDLRDVQKDRFLAQLPEKAIDKQRNLWRIRKTLFLLRNL